MGQSSQAETIEIPSIDDLEQVDGKHVVNEDFLQSALEALRARGMEQGDVIRVADDMPDFTVPGDASHEREATLTRFKFVEDRILLCPTNLIYRNPAQPRENFLQEEMGVLDATMNAEGQLDEVKVNPCIVNGELRFVLIDGERRWRTARAQDRPLKVLVRWIPTLAGMKRIGAIVNLARAGHNVLEVARALKDAFADGEKHEKSRMDVIRDLGMARATAYRALHVLKIVENCPDELRPSIEARIRSGELTNSNILGLLAKRRTSSEDAQTVVSLQIAQVLAGKGSSDPEDNASPKAEPAGGGKVTTRGLLEQRAALMVQGGDPRGGRALQLDHAIVGVASRVQALAREARALTKNPGDHDLVVQRLRERGTGKPPEVLRDQIREAIAALTKLLPLSEESVAPPPLTLPEGAPKFAAYIRRGGLLDSVQHEARKIMVTELAKISDGDPDVLSAHDLAKAAHIEVSTIGRHIAELEKEIAAFGLCIDSQPIRTAVDRKGKERYEINPGYRLAWKPEKATIPSSRSKDLGTVTRESPIQSTHFGFSEDAKAKLLGSRTESARLAAARVYKLHGDQSNLQPGKRRYLIVTGMGKGETEMLYPSDLVGVQYIAPTKAQGNVVASTKAYAHERFVTTPTKVVPMAASPNTSKADIDFSATAHREGAAGNEIVVLVDPPEFQDAANRIAQFLNSPKCVSMHNRQVHTIEGCDTSIVIKLRRPSGSRPRVFEIKSNIKNFNLNFGAMKSAFASIIKDNAGGIIGPEKDPPVSVVLNDARSKKDFN